ncbi:hypothetical protein [Insolitispirillum peregrinum]|uniref:hypothetical protein n=1 Tax=Insolitispirillum peregrinum TaxID=80876 RepID=UPI00360FFC8B
MDSPTGMPRKLFTAELQRRQRGSGDGGERHASSPSFSSGDSGQMMRELRSMKEELRSLDHLLRAHFEPADEVDEDAPQDDPILREYERQKQEVMILRTELRALANSIQETKREIAHLRSSHTQGDRLVVVAGELDAIVGSTEQATEGILDAAEKIDTIAHTLKAAGDDTYTTRLAEDLTEHVMVIFEHCNFQDITGQRTTKVVNTLKFIEDRIDKMISIWGQESFAELIGEEDHSEDDARLLNGPQLGAAAISQDEIDRLFD